MDALSQDALEALEWQAVRDMVQAHTATAAGSHLAAALLPQSVPTVVRQEQQLTVESVFLLRAGDALPFHALKDLTTHLQRLTVKRARLEGEELYDLCLLLRNAEDLRGFIANQGAGEVEIPHLGELSAALPDLSALRREVGEHLSPSGEVLDSASSELRNLRRRLVHLSEKLTGELQSIIDRADANIFLRDEYITVRNGRFVLPIRTDSPIPVPGILHGRSSTGLTHFVEPLTTVTINNEIVSLREAEEEMVERLLRDYTRLFQAARPAVCDTAVLVGRFDLIQARGRLALEMDAVPAEEGEQVMLQDARHPVLEKTLGPQGDSPVPISLELGGDYPVLIISGPNTGGKTVALKTLGLLVLMHQAGLLIPARAARLPVFRRVLVDIGDHQSIAANLSTFSAHMKNIGWMTGQVKLPTLVLLDEIGTGTDPGEGAALGVSILEYFRRQGALLVVTTHMSGIKSHGYSTQGVKNACVEFNEETLQPTFRLLLGVAGSSSGIEIARRLGLPDALVEDARQRLGSAGGEVEDYLRRVKETLQETAQAGERLAEERREAQRERAQALEEAARREKERGRIFREELQAAVERYDKELKEQLRSVRDKVLRRKLEREGARRRDRVLGAMDRELGEHFEPDSAGSLSPPTAVVPGDLVRIPALRQSGVVESAAAPDRIRVQVGGKTLHVALKDLLLEESPPQDQPSKRRPALRVRFDAPDRPPPGREMNLVGCRVDEALPRLDKFLDEAFLADYKTVRLVHGHGTGTLRRAIAEFLKGHPHVANYRLADDREGGTAVTQVDLR